MVYFRIRWQVIGCAFLNNQPLVPVDAHRDDLIFWTYADTIDIDPLAILVLLLAENASGKVIGLGVLDYSVLWRKRHKHLHRPTAT